VQNKKQSNYYGWPIKVLFGDAADDPAIWMHASQPEKSLIFGTDKKYGLNLYSLRGELVQTLAVGKISNIDIRQNIFVNGQYKDIAVVSADVNPQLFAAA
jgi:3-phytase